MRCCAAWFASCLVLGAAAGAAGETFPYVAYVAVDEAEYLSGPGSEFYAAGRLSRGEAVEVYRHDVGEEAGAEGASAANGADSQGTWCAIRPPEGSFSWVPARDLELLEDGLARVRRLGVEARVGSLLDAKRDVRQVKFERGDLVEIVDAQPVRMGGLDWLRIAPPAGEFRWIARSLLTRQRPAVVPLPPRRLPEEEAEARADESPDGAEPPAANSAAAGFRPKSGPADLETELEAVNLALAAVVADDPAAWSLDELRSLAESALDRAQDVAQRTMARQVLRRIERFEKIQAGLRELASSATQRREDASPAAEPAALAANPSPPAETPAAETPKAETAALASPAAVAPLADRRFDGQGKLTRVVTTKVGDPQFALLDADGAVQAYVSAAPGVNLRRYVGREVGVNGLQGYIPQFQAQHVMAKRVTLLDGPSWR